MRLVNGSFVSLSLEDCKQITDVSCQLVAMRCVSLRKLNLGDCVGVTDVGLRRIAESCPYLDELVLDNCPLITDHSITIIAQRCSSSLRHLSLSGCSKLTDVSLREIPLNCKLLTQYRLRRCAQVSY